MAVRIQLRRDTAANWASVNPVLASGEEGLESDTGRRKIGDGVSAWSSLPYVELAASKVTGGVVTEGTLAPVASKKLLVLLTAGGDFSDFEVVSV